MKQIVLQQRVSPLQMQRVDVDLNQLQQPQPFPLDQRGEAAGEGSSQEEVGGAPHHVVLVVLAADTNSFFEIKMY